MIQKIINILYRQPKSDMLMYKRFGGYFSYRKMMANSALMQKASLSLPPVNLSAEGLPVYFLTGKKYLYQTLFCIRSLNKVSGTRFKFILVDDGTFDTALIEQINKQLPGATIITAEQIEQNLNATLPLHQYPNLHHKRQVYPHIKKLTDIHTIPGNQWKLVLDADMLFWAEPTAIIDWLNSPLQPIYMLDCVPSYGYSSKLMAKLCGRPIPELLNVGVIGLNSNAINWADIENWVNILEKTEGTSYYLEQALTAMIIGDTAATILTPAEYIVNPAESAVDINKGTLHHYVDLSKKSYFNKAWQKLV